MSDKKYTLDEALLLGAATPAIVAAIVVSTIPFTLWAVWVAQRIWEWFLQSRLGATPPLHTFYAVALLVNLYKTKEYLKEEPKRSWGNALLGGIIGPAMVLAVAYCMHRIWAS